MEQTSDQSKLGRLRLKHSLIVPVSFLILIWLIKIFEWFFDFDLHQLGIFPLEAKGLPGLITAPLIHSDFNHLMANTVPLFVLLWSIFYFYRPLAYRIFFLSYIITNLWIWVSAREGWHIGASGLVYAFAAFLFFSGIIRNYFRLIAISLIVVFLYGGMFWGIFPILRDVSWEGHLLGSFSGILLAIIYRKEGPQRPSPQWEDQEDEIPEEIWNAENLKKKREEKSDHTPSPLNENNKTHQDNTNTPTTS